MTVSLKHNRVSTQPDDASKPELVQPSEWNDEHALTQAGERMLGKPTAGAGATEEMTGAQVLSFAGAEAAGAAAAAVAAHEAAPDPHAQYLTAAEGDALFLTPAEGNAAYDALGAASAAVTAHEGAADPHTGYQKESEKSAASGYASLDGTTKVPTAELGTGVADATTFLRGDRSWASPGASSTNIKATTVTVSAPIGDASFTVADADVSPSSQIKIGWGNCAQSDANHPGMGAVGFNAIPGSGQFTAELFSLDNTELFGDFKLNYLVG
jgi:hypothetical protein